MPRIKGIYFPIVDFKLYAEMMRDIGPAAPTVFGLLALSQKHSYRDPISGVQRLEDGRCKLPANLFKQFGVTPGNLKKHLEYFQSKRWLTYTEEKPDIVFSIVPSVYLAPQPRQSKNHPYMMTVAEEE